MCSMCLGNPGELRDERQREPKKETTVAGSNSFTPMPEASAGAATGPTMAASP